MNKQILILGKGYLGQRLSKEFNCSITDRRIHTFSDLNEIIKKYNPKIIINAIGFTGANNVDGCESDKDKTLFSNTYVPILLAEICAREGIKLVHLSSGCIYHYVYKKQRPIKETLHPDFYDLYYSRSKIYTEDVLVPLSKKYNILIARLRVPLDFVPHPKNILSKLLNYRQVIDIPNSVTYIPEFIDGLKHLIKIDARGLYNMVCKEPLRYPQLLDIYRRYIPDFEYKIIPLKSLKMVRTNLILSTRKLEKSGFKLKPLKTILQECVKNYLKS